MADCTTGRNRYRVQWTQEGDGYRCLRHAELFGRTGMCQSCMTDPAPSDDESDEVADLPDPPKDCRSTAQHEADMTWLYRRLEKSGRELLDEADGNLSAVAAATKLIDTALKACRIAIELTKTRESEHVVRHRMKQMKKLLSRVRH